MSGWRHLRGFLYVTLIAAILPAQEIQVYSEFRRVDPFGKLVPQDEGGRPREILSPLAARNSHWSFHVVVSAPSGMPFYLFVGSNPKNIFRFHVYKEMWSKQDGTWIPDKLLEVKTPYLSHIPDRYHGLPNQVVECFLVDVFVPKTLPPARYKFEPQVSCGGAWAIYPMEVRVSGVAAPDFAYAGARLPSVTRSAGSVVLGPLREYLCGEAEQKRNAPVNLRAIIRRNVLEDLAIARLREKEVGRETMANHLLRGLNMDAASFCAAKDLPGKSGPEWFLRARDFLYKGNPALY